MKKARHATSCVRYFIYAEELPALWPSTYEEEGWIGVGARCILPCGRTRGHHTNPARGKIDHAQVTPNRRAHNTGTHLVTPPAVLVPMRELLDYVLNRIRTRAAAAQHTKLAGSGPGPLCMP